MTSMGPAQDYRGGGQDLMPAVYSSWHCWPFLRRRWGIPIHQPLTTPTGKPWIHHVSQQDSPWVKQKELRSSGDGAWPNVIGIAPLPSCS